MSETLGQSNTEASPPRVLVIDDSASVRDLFQSILTPATLDARLNAPPASIETGVPAQAHLEWPPFELCLAANGEEGRDRVALACSENRPYAVAFVDMRMPGWDGLATAAALWQLDPELQIVICTAYSDYDWGQAIAKLGCSDRWLLLKKPFEAIEALQMAWSLADKWRLQRAQRTRLDALEQKVEERVAELRRVNRTLHMITLCTDALVRSGDEKTLLATVCARIVEDGGYKLAWIGFALHDDTRTVLPVAHAGGDAETLAALQISWNDGARGQGPGGRAIREGRPVACRHIDRDPLFAPWRDAALERGFASLLALPLRTRSEVFGNLSIYSSIPDAFDVAEVKLLQELANNVAYGIASLRHSAARARAERQLEYQANYDALTGLPNRSLLCDRLQQALVHAQRAQRQVAVILLSVDRYERIRDGLGEAAGNTLLKLIGARLPSCVRAEDSVAHFGHGQFAIMLGDLEPTEDVTPIACKLAQATESPLDVLGHEIVCAASMGIALSASDGADVDQLLQRAASALRFAQAEVGNAFHFYAPAMNQRASTRLTLEAELRLALTRSELLLHFQPKVSLVDGRLTGAEALVRWNHPTRGLLMPGHFIPMAEESILIVALGEWVIREVCAQLTRWRRNGLACVPVAVNVSARQFRQQNLCELLRTVLQENEMDPALLELEITESALMENLSEAAALLHTLKATGVKLTLDDFGTGYSSLSHLQRFPIDKIKIDRSFVSDVTVNPADAAICRSVIGLAHALRLRVVGEGVETQGQLNYLRLHRCDEMQGYLFSRPLTPADFEQMLQCRPAMALPDFEVAQGRTLLVVDDERNVLAALRRLLRREGFRVLTADSAKEGLELLALHRVQVVLSDQRMPGMSGTEFLARVRELYPETIRLILSGYTDLNTVVEAVNRGTLFKFLTKPWDDDVLRAQLREAFQYHEMRASLASDGAAVREPVRL